MTQSFVSSVPGIHSALLGLIGTAAAAQPAPQPSVFDFALAQYEPAAYVVVESIDDLRYEWESIGSFAQKETYSISGFVTVFTGDTLANQAGVTTTVLAQTQALLQACVLTPVFSNRTMPLLGTAGPSPYVMLPGRFAYSFGPGEMADGPAGWAGRIDWSFDFEAVITPA